MTTRKALLAAIAAVEAFRNAPVDPIAALRSMDSRCVGLVVEHGSALLAALDAAYAAGQAAASAPRVPHEVTCPNCGLPHEVEP